MRKGYENEETCKDWFARLSTWSSRLSNLTVYLSGDRIIVVVQKQRNFSESGPGASVSTSAANKVRRGDIRHAVVVRTVKKLQRPDGSVVKFDDNACVLINKAGEPIGTRLNGKWCYQLFRFSLLTLSRCGWLRIKKDEVVKNSITSTYASVDITVSGMNQCSIATPAFWRILDNERIYFPPYWHSREILMFSINSNPMQQTP